MAIWPTTNTGLDFGGSPVFTTSDSTNDWGYVTSPNYYTQHTTYTGLSDLVLGTPTKKEAPMKGKSETLEAIREARAERAEERVKEALDEVERAFSEQKPDAGTVLYANVTFPDRDKTYEYAWVKGEKSWCRTFSTVIYTTDDVIDELVRLIVDSTEINWWFRD